MYEPRINPKYTEAISNVVNQSPYFELLSMKIKDLEWGTALLEVDLGGKHLQPFGYSMEGPSLRSWTQQPSGLFFFR